MSSCPHLNSLLSYERLESLGLVEITLSGVLGFLPKCASTGEVFLFFDSIFTVGE